MKKTEFDNIKTLRKVKIKRGNQYLLVFRVDHSLTPTEYRSLRQSIKTFRKRLEKKMDIVLESVLLEGGVTLDIIEKGKDKLTKADPELSGTVTFG